MNETATKEYLTTKDVADLTGFAPITLRKWRSQGEGNGPNYFKVGTQVRYRPVDVKQWMEQRPRD